MPAPASPVETLLLAVEYGNAQTTTQLLRSNPQLVTSVSREGNTLIHLAQLNRHEYLIPLLITHGASTEIPDAQGRKPIFLAAEHNYTGQIQALLANGANVESRHAVSQITALYCAVDAENLEAAQLLIEHGADVDARDPIGSTPLIRAVIRDNVQIAELLLRHGANRRIRRPDGLSARDFAQGGREMMALLAADLMIEGPKIAKDGSGDDAEHQSSGARGAGAIPLPIEPEGDPAKMRAVRGFQAVVVDFFVGESERRIQKVVPVWDILYGDGAEKLMASARGVDSKKPTFRWYHLPANHMEWVEGLMRRHFSDRGHQGHEFSDETKLKLGLLSRGRGKNQWSATPPTSLMRSGCRSVKMHDDTTGTGSSSNHFVSFLPFLHYETKPGLKAMIETLSRAPPKLPPSGPDAQDVTTNVSYDASKLHEDLLVGYLASHDTDGMGPPLQLRRTLDRYLYVHLETKNERDGDQVILRYTNTWPEPRLFVVDQLWLWVLSDDTVISCFPTIWHGKVKTRSVRSRKSNLSQPRQTMPTAGQHIPKYPTRPPVQPFHPQSQWTSPLGIIPLQAGLFDNINDNTPIEEIHAAMQAAQQDDASDDGLQFTAEDDPLNVMKKVFRYLNVIRRDPITSARELACLITNLCVCVFDPHEVPDDFQFFDFFEQSIGAVNDKAVSALHRFRTTLRQLDGDSGGREEQVRARLSIRSETELLVEADDIRDELGILRIVLQDQQQVLTDMYAILRGNTGSNASHNTTQPSNEFPDIRRSDQRPIQPASFSPTSTYVESSTSGDYDFLTTANRIVASHSQRVEKLDKLAERTSRSLTDLLDLKQKQASITEALSQRKQAVLAAAHTETLAKQALWQKEQAINTERQGKTVLLFTVVTIVFLPMSLIVSFFTINVSSFPYDPEGRIPIDYVLKFVLSISAGVSIPFILVIFNLERVWAMLNWLGSIRTSRWAIGVFIFVSIISVIPVWTSSTLSMGFKAALTIVISILVLVALVGVLLRQALSKKTPMLSTTTSETWRSLTSMY